ncbi:hypothetical protein G5I_07513 [Acromyrmex echinatior]|uniref:Uncharacterized protein n=1 Tax=Acromyrmex echinatior TaxID=103372 RepID=F4WP03_ACREC|nr:hypothetical protein G5I_07513 [Acromyrmex echinatior]
MPNTLSCFGTVNSTCSRGGFCSESGESHPRTAMAATGGIDDSPGIVGGVACRRPGYRGGDSAKADPSPPIARRPVADTHLRASVCVRVFVRVCAMGPPESNMLPLPFLSYTPDLPPPAAPRIASDQT